jgi:hypothetical protein
MIELWLNDELMDISGQEDVVVTFAINNLLDIASRSGAYSNTFNLPKTNHNKLKLGNAQQLLSNTFIPYERLEMRLNVTGLPIIKGYAILLSAKKTYELQVFGNNADWFEDAKQKNLEEFIDLVDLNHFWTEANVLANRANLWADGFIYPNIDYGLWLNNATNDVQYYEFYIATYQKYIFKKIFSTIGLTIVSEWLDETTDIENEVLPFSGRWKRDKRYQHRWYTKISSDAVVFTTTSVGGELVNPVVVESGPYNHFNLSGFTSRWIILDPITVKYRLVGTTSNFDLVTNEGRVRAFQFERNTNTAGSPVAVDVATFNVAPGTNPIDIEFELDGNYIYIIQMFSPDSNNMNIDNDFTIEAISYEEYEVENIDSFLKIISEDDCFVPDSYNYISVSGTLADVKMIDFIKTFTNKYCLMYDSNINAGLIKIFPFQDVVNNTANADDWSNKLDRSEEPEISFRSDGYFQNNTFKYATDDSDQLLIEAPEFGQGILTIDDNNLEVDGIVFESVYAPVLRRESFLSATPTKEMAYIPKFIDGEENICTPRMASIRFDADNNITISGNPEEPTQPAVYFDEPFNTVLLPVYYPALDEVTSQFKMVRCLMNLNPADINNLDYRKPKYISYFKCYFYLNEIEQFKMNKREPCWVQLIKID